MYIKLSLSYTGEIAVSLFIFVYSQILLRFSQVSKFCVTTIHKTKQQQKELRNLLCKIMDLDNRH